ncbi:hypothetical protein GGE16_002808 [Rhizobium leguminosarum]|uniref:Uncharacterized protein n=1 Tax=Rhizobium leguminosarum TaxID=384 RepID=A0AAE2MJY8_RHILE|nr:hypothetical protein [Rhizobium leguminosarum]MBB4431931.1 hypothetical protein [Rhizobium esperanzae]MBB4297471.1 hypothetical protein [Rhizobium leguminosarum]MBB4415102.1 hypothetical protein [Rhizobium leguminosarum]MBB4539453.1 hypothetical protein [Rhizobium leguminosarum]
MLLDFETGLVIFPQNVRMDLAPLNSVARLDGHLIGLEELELPGAALP